MRVLRISNKL